MLGSDGPGTEFLKLLPQRLGVSEDFSCAGSAVEILARHYSLFSVAYGVSHHRAHYPPFLQPRGLVD